MPTSESDHAAAIEGIADSLERRLDRIEATRRRIIQLLDQLEAAAESSPCENPNAAPTNL